MALLIKLFASALFVGYIPVAPGTFGSLVAIPLAIAQAHLAACATWAALAGLVLFIALSAWCAGRAETIFGGKDSRQIVIDEVAGYLAATLFLPPTWGVLGAAFLLFRLFDVLKPFPAAWIDREVGGGWGVVLDDVVAGLYTQICLRAVLWLG
ncbi:MAG: phosphatidylglycerophosphatase A [Candidatus Binatia bacterium]|nr:phosphatidylglycerophosphatase A [Candidatus Binatia bacterium]